MLKILLCDDDIRFLSLEETVVRDILSNDILDASLCGCARTASEALALIDEGDYLVFLDLDFGRNMPNGIDISTALKQRSRSVRVVFTTNHGELAMKVLRGGIEPFGFLEKGDSLIALSDGIRRYIKMAAALCEKDDGCGMITLNVGGEEVRLRVHDITYAESEKNLSHGITYHTSAGSKITIISTLDAEGARLGEDFIRVHRSYLVNRRHIVSYRGGVITMSDRAEIYCSVKKRAEVKKWLGERK